MVRAWVRILSVVALSVGRIEVVARGEIRPAAMFTSGMVLPSEARVPIWGTAVPQARVTIQANWPGGRRIQLKADAVGRWQARLRTPEAGGPYEIELSSAAGKVRLTDILVGEVWLAAGGLNMARPLGPSDGQPGAPGWQDAAGTRDPWLRFFVSQRVISAGPRDERAGLWLKAERDHLDQISAVAYGFGRRLRRALNVPVGVIVTPSPDAAVEAWLPRAAARPIVRLRSVLSWLETLDHGSPRFEKLLARQWQGWKVHFRREAGQSPFVRPDFDDRPWPRMPQPNHWSGGYLGAHDGVVWFRRTVTIPAAWAGRELMLSLGRIDDQDVSFFNGQPVGDTLGPWRYGEPRRYRVPAELVRPGRATLAIWVFDSGEPGGLWGPAEDMHLGPVGAPPEQCIDLSGPWAYWIGPTPAGMTRFMPWPSPKPWYPTVAYNGMMAPWSRWPLRGILWAHGELSYTRADRYGELLETLLRGWRSALRRSSLPVGLVQLPAYHYPCDAGRAATIREAQRQVARRLRNVGLVVTADLGSTADVHVADPLEVGRRLALWALAKVYGRLDQEYSGPRVLATRRLDDGVRVDFTHVDGGLVARGGRPRGFELAGADGVFHPAEAEIDGTSILVRSPRVTDPQAVRYGWAPSPDVNVFNGAGLPAGPFVERLSAAAPASARRRARREP